MYRGRNLQKKMNKSALAISILEMMLDEWDIKKEDKTFFIFDSDKKILAKGKKLSKTVIKARENAISSLRGY